MTPSSMEKMKLLVLVLIFLPFISTLAQLLSHDIQALLAFKKEIIQDPSGYILDSWNDESIDFNGCPSTWNGIVCSGANVAGVVLNNLSLSANTDLSVFTNLTMLVKLSLSNNAISGKLSAAIGDFGKLQYLDISNNLFSETLPVEIGRLKSLTNLSLAINNFSGSVPKSIRGLISIQSLDLSQNSFSGALPEALTSLKRLVSLNLSFNEFTQSIPSGFEKLENLEVLDLHQNRLTGVVDNEFLFLSKVSYVDFGSNLLTSSSSQKLFQFGLSSSLHHLNLSNNQLTGSFHETDILSMFANLKVLDLNHNQLSGELPGLNFIYDLEILRLSSNMISGFIPRGLLREDSLVLTELDLSSNNLSVIGSWVQNWRNLPENSSNGTFMTTNSRSCKWYPYRYHLKRFLQVFVERPPMAVRTAFRLAGKPYNPVFGLGGMHRGPIGPITSITLKVLNLSSNSFSGELAALTGSCEVLDLSRNQISGNLSAMSHWGNNVKFLDISQNQLMGSFPEVTSQFLRLNHLNLSHNSLVNSLPLLLTQYPKLRILDLSFNRFDGPLLADLITSPTLQELHVHHNLLYGKIQFIPPSPNKLSLQILDLSSNHFNGTLPDEFGVLTGLKILDIAGNNFSGPLPSALTKLEFLISLDISLNKFTGPLPENLPDSLNSFNASYNDLSGLIPVNLRKFPDSSFHPGNSKLLLPQAPPGPGTAPSGKAHRKRIKTIIRAAVIVSCVIAVIILILLAIFTHYKRISTKQFQLETSSGKVVHTGLQDIERAGGYKGKDSGGGALVISADDLLASRKGSSSEIISPDENVATVSGYSPSKNSQLSWSPDSSDSFTPEHFGKLRMQSPDRLAGELHFLDDNLMLTPEELSRAPAEVLGRSSHGTSYKAVLDNGVLLTVKWLREGLAKPKKEFAKEAKKFSNIRHPNVVGLRGYYWGPTQNEKLILSDYIAPGSLANFLYDRPGRIGPPLTWIQRLKIAVDIARGLNYLHFDRAVPHGNLKATNILLEGPELNARVANYCLHRLTIHAGTVEQILDAGVLGYRAPELASARKPMPSFKSDIYSFGVILLELLTGRCAGDVVSGEEGGIDLTDWVQRRVAEGHESDCFDGVLSPELGNPAAVKGMKEALGIALRCIRPVSERPGIKSVYEDLSSI